MISSEYIVHEVEPANESELLQFRVDTAIFEQFPQKSPVDPTTQATWRKTRLNKHREITLATESLGKVIETVSLNSILGGTAKISILAAKVQDDNFVSIKFFS